MKALFFKSRKNGYYRIVKQTLYNPELGKYKAYGIKYSKKITINDVSCNASQARHIAHCLNRMQTSPLKLAEAIESLL